MLYQLVLVGLRDVAMPVKDRNAFLLAQLAQTRELVIDECLQGCDVEHADGSRWIFRKKREDREKGGFRLARGSRGAQQHIFLCLKDSFPCRNLDSAQALPVASVNIFLNKRRVTVVNFHVINPTKS